MENEYVKVEKEKEPKSSGKGHLVIGIAVGAMLAIIGFIVLILVLNIATETEYDKEDGHITSAEAAAIHKEWNSFISNVEENGYTKEDVSAFIYKYGERGANIDDLLEEEEPIFSDLDDVLGVDIFMQIFVFRNEEFSSIEDVDEYLDELEATADDE